jgi:N-acetylmuramate 1-kinase
MPQRLEALTQWLNTVLNVHNGAAPAIEFQLTPASSDASFRRYFRLRITPSRHNKTALAARMAPSLIVMDAPPEKEKTQPFVTISTLLTEIGLNAPRILAQNAEQGFLLLSDLGCQEYLGILNEHSADHLYADALAALLVMQRDGPRDRALLPVYDKALLLSEMVLFRDWYCQQQCGLSFSHSQSVALEGTFQLLSEAALAQPQVFVHRDYHSRNLMKAVQNNPGILDFQDAVVGPVSYDLVSLLRDCYIAWPRERVESWALGYLHTAAEVGVIERQDDASYLRWFDWMGVQRHLKAIGIFARLNLRDGKPDYLNDIPRTLNYVREVSARYVELQPLLALLDELALRAPALAK